MGERGVGRGCSEVMGMGNGGRKGLSCGDVIVAA